MPKKSRNQKKIQAKKAQQAAETQNELIGIEIAESMHNAEIVYQTANAAARNNHLGVALQLYTKASNDYKKILDLPDLNETVKDDCQKKLLEIQNHISTLSLPRADVSESKSKTHTSAQTDDTSAEDCDFQAEFDDLEYELATGDMAFDDGDMTAAFECYEIALDKYTELLNNIESQTQLKDDEAIQALVQKVKDKINELSEKIKTEPFIEASIERAETFLQEKNQEKNYEKAIEYFDNANKFYLLQLESKLEDSPRKEIATKQENIAKKLENAKLQLAESLTQQSTAYDETDTESDIETSNITEIPDSLQKAANSALSENKPELAFSIFDQACQAYQTVIDTQLSKLAKEDADKIKSYCEEQQQKMYTLGNTDLSLIVQMEKIALRCLQENNLARGQQILSLVHTNLRKFFETAKTPSEQVAIQDKINNAKFSIRYEFIKPTSDTQLTKQNPQENKSTNETTSAGTLSRTELQSKIAAFFEDEADSAATEKYLAIFNNLPQPSFDTPQERTNHINALGEAIRDLNTARSHMQTAKVYHNLKQFKVSCIWLNKALTAFQEIQERQFLNLKKDHTDQIKSYCQEKQQEIQLILNFFLALGELLISAVHSQQTGLAQEEQKFTSSLTALVGEAKSLPITKTNSIFDIALEPTLNIFPSEIESFYNAITEANKNIYAQKPLSDRINGYHERGIAYKKIGEYYKDKQLQHFSQIYFDLAKQDFKLLHQFVKEDSTVFSAEKLTEIDAFLENPPKVTPIHNQPSKGLNTKKRAQAILNNIPREIPVREEFIRKYHEAYVIRADMAQIYFDLAERLTLSERYIEGYEFYQIGFECDPNHNDARAYYHVGFILCAFANRAKTRGFPNITSYLFMKMEFFFRKALEKNQEKSVLEDEEKTEATSRLSTIDSAKKELGKIAPGMGLEPPKDSTSSEASSTESKEEISASADNTTPTLEFSMEAEKLRTLLADLKEETLTEMFEFVKSGKSAKSTSTWVQAQKIIYHLADTPCSYNDKKLLINIVRQFADNFLNTQKYDQAYKCYMAVIDIYHKINTQSFPELTEIEASQVKADCQSKTNEIQEILKSNLSLIKIKLKTGIYLQKIGSEDGAYKNFDEIREMLKQLLPKAKTEQEKNEIKKFYGQVDNLFHLVNRWATPIMHALAKSTIEKIFNQKKESTPTTKTKLPNLNEVLKDIENTSSQPKKPQGNKKKVTQTSGESKSSSTTDEKPKSAKSSQIGAGAGAASLETVSASAVMKDEMPKEEPKEDDSMRKSKITTHLLDGHKAFKIPDLQTAKEEYLAAQTVFKRLNVQTERLKIIIENDLNRIEMHLLKAKADQTYSKGVDYILAKQEYEEILKLLPIKPFNDQKEFNKFQDRVTALRKKAEEKIKEILATAEAKTAAELQPLPTQPADISQPPADLNAEEKVIVATPRAEEKLAAPDQAPLKLDATLVAENTQAVAPVETSKQEEIVETEIEVDPSSHTTGATVASEITVSNEIMKLANLVVASNEEKVGLAIDELRSKLPEVHEYLSTSLESQKILGELKTKLKALLEDKIVSEAKNHEIAGTFLAVLLLKESFTLYDVKEFDKKAHSASARDGVAKSATLKYLQSFEPELDAFNRPQKIFRHARNFAAGLIEKLYSADPKLFMPPTPAKKTSFVPAMPPVFTGPAPAAPQLRPLPTYPQQVQYVSAPPVSAPVYSQPVYGRPIFAGTQQSAVLSSVPSYPQGQVPMMAYGYTGTGYAGAGYAGAGVQQTASSYPGTFLQQQQLLQFRLQQQQLQQQQLQQHLQQQQLQQQQLQLQQQYRQSTQTGAGAGAGAGAPQVFYPGPQFRRG